MRVLVTSGGTKIPIDSVRSITNMSNGTFGSQIADAFSDNMECDYGGLTFLSARRSERMSMPNACDELVCFETFSEYEDKLFRALEDQPDIVVLAAAVSDYEVENQVDGKMRTSDDMVIRLRPLPKLIGHVRRKCPNAVICGFKLLVNSTREDLIDAARKSIVENNIDLVVANDLFTIRNEDHSLHIVEADWNAEFFRSEHNLALTVRDFCMSHYYRKAGK